MLFFIILFHFNNISCSSFYRWTFWSALCFWLSAEYSFGGHAIAHFHSVSIKGHCGCLQFCPVASGAPVNILVHVSLGTCVRPVTGKINPAALCSHQEGAEVPVSHNLSGVALWMARLSHLGQCDRWNIVYWKCIWPTRNESSVCYPKA